MSLGSTPSCRAVGRKWKVQTISLLSLLYKSLSALLIRFYYLHQSQLKNVCQFQFKIFEIMSEMSGVSFLISSPHRGFWPALYVRELKKMWSRLVFVLFYSFNIVNIIEISSKDSVRGGILFIFSRSFLRMWNILSLRLNSFIHTCQKKFLLQSQVSYADIYQHYCLVEWLCQN